MESIKLMQRLKTAQAQPPRMGLRVLWVLTIAGVLAWWTCAHAQVSVTGRGKNFVAPVTDAQGHKSVLRGDDFKPAGKGLMEITGMRTETYRGTEKDMIVEAPQCVFDQKLNVATSSGSLAIRTADERFSIEGKAFRWQLGDSRLTSKLSISNQVHSLVRKRFVAGKPGSGLSSVPGRTPASGTNLAPRPLSGDAGTEFIEITSDQFEYQADQAVFRGNVHVHEAEGDLVCGELTVLFAGENGALQRIEAQRDVVLTQTGTRIIADKAIYSLGQDKEQIEFLGNAIWQDGVRQGGGDHVFFDRREHVLRVDANAYLKLPRGALGESGFLVGAPAAVTPAATNGPNAFVEVFADLITMRLPATNGPVQQIIAEKNVLIVDPEQDGRALADRAIYDESAGSLELTGTPLLETEKRLITGKVLRFDRTTKVFRAGPDAYVKLPFQALASLGMLSGTTSAAGKPVARTNQFVEVWARDFEYGTNFLHFHGEVRANFLEGDLVRGKLTCADLAVEYGAQVQRMLARTNVELEQFSVVTEPHPAARRVGCELLDVRFTEQGRIEVAMARQGVAAEQEETRPGTPRPVLTRLTSDSLTAFFSSTTNNVERIEADKDVVFAQDERVARGAKAVYSGGSGLLELTGQPTATMPEGQITEAERLIFDRIHTRLIGKGKFKSEWKRPAGTNQVSAAPPGTP